MVIASGNVGRRRFRTLREHAAFRVASSTWHLSRSKVLFPDAEPRGLNPPPHELAKRHTKWAADFLGLVREHRTELLRHTFVTARGFGDLDGFEWTRLCVVYARQLELRHGRRKT